MGVRGRAGVGSGCAPRNPFCHAGILSGLFGTSQFDPWCMISCKCQPCACPPPAPVVLCFFLGPLHGAHQCCPPREGGRWRRQCQEPRTHLHRTETDDRVWPEIFLNCSTCDPYENAQGHHLLKSAVRQNTGQGCVGSEMVGKRERGQSNRSFPGPNSLRPPTPMKKRPEKGTPAVRTADASTKRSRRNPQVPPRSPRGTEGGANGKGAAGNCRTAGEGWG